MTNNSAAPLRQLIFDDADVIGATPRRSQLFQDQRKRGRWPAQKRCRRHSVRLIVEETLRLPRDVVEQVGKMME